MAQAKSTHPSRGLQVAIIRAYAAARTAAERRAIADAVAAVARGSARRDLHLAAAAVAAVCR